MGDEPILITIGQLRDAFIKWEEDYRANPDDYATAQEIREKTAGNAGVANADHLWSLLNGG